MKNPFNKTPFPSFKDPDTLSEEDAGKEIKQPREAIEQHNFQYYIQNKPAISDHQYDKLFQRLLELEEHYPGLRSDVSPSRKVGAAPIDHMKKREHVAPMLSLHSSYNEKDVIDFLENIREMASGNHTDSVLEPKFDGLSVEVVYKGPDQSCFHKG
jgi:DNA ligase (NAD+)